MAVITEPIRRVRDEVFARFPEASNAGVFNCRRIRPCHNPPCGWSQHSWGNAIDVAVPSKEVGDRVFRWATLNRGRLGIGKIIWWTEGHWDHLHIEGAPKQRGVPPCAGGNVEGRAVVGRDRPKVDGGGPFPDWMLESVRGRPGGWLVTEIIEPASGLAEAIRSNPLSVGVGVLLDSSTWVRVGLAVGGVGLMAGGLVMFARSLGVSVPVNAVGVARKVLG